MTRVSEKKDSLFRKQYSITPALQYSIVYKEDRMSPTSQQAARHYAKCQVQTASHPKRICMLHARCVELITMAVEEESAVKRRLLLDRAQNILSQLLAVLRVDDAVSKGLLYLYDYCYVLLGRGEQPDCAQAQQIILVLRDTFQQLLKTL